MRILECLQRESSRFRLYLPRYCVAGVVGWLFLLLLLAQVVAGAQQFTARVVAVTDGDTMTVRREGQIVKLRLHGVDTPERRQPFGGRAKQFVAALAFGKDVRVQVQDKDRWQRLIAVVILPDGRVLNHEVVRAGYAWWFRRYAPGDRTLERLESDARRSGSGLWQQPSPVPPWEWRRGRRTPLAVSAPR